MDNPSSTSLSRQDVDYLVQSEARLRLLLATLPQGLLVFDRLHLLVTTIKQPDGGPELPGLHEGKLPDEAVWGEENLRLFLLTIDDVFATGRKMRLNIRLPRQPNAPSRLFDVVFSRMEQRFVLAVVNDITEDEQKNAEREAAASRQSHANKQESLTLLAAGIAHDVNNILGVVLNTTETTWMDADDEKTLLAVDTIRDAVRRGTSMMRELMTFAGEARSNLARIEDPTSLIWESSRLAHGVVGPSIVLSFDLPTGLPAIDADPAQFWKVVFNLIKNAAEAMKDHPGEIHVSAEAFEMTPAEADTFTTPFTPRSGRGVLYSVIDNGPGIPQGFLRRIFDPYTSSKSVNRGLGLAIVSSIIEAHGGGIRVRSSEGFGTRFDIFVPVSRQPAPQPQKPAAAHAAPAPLTPAGLSNARSILIVDDEPSIVRTTSILLQTLKFAPHAAASRHDAMIQFRTHSSGLRCVLMDAHLGEIDTVRLLRAFRIANPSVPVVIVSGSSPEKIAEMFAAQPYDAFLAKPFTFAELKTCIDTLPRLNAGLRTA